MVLHKIAKTFPYRKENVQEEKYTFSLLKHAIIVVTGYKFMSLNLKHISIYNTVEHAMLHNIFVVEIRKRSHSSKEKRKKEQQQQMNTTPLE